MSVVVDLPPDLLEFVDEYVASGEAPTREQAVLDAVRFGLLMQAVFSDCKNDRAKRFIARETFRREALASWASYQETGRHYSCEEVLSWLNTWGTGDEFGDRDPLDPLLNGVIPCSVDPEVDL